LSEYAQRKLEALELNSKQVAGNVPTYKRKHFVSNTPKVYTKQSLKSKIFEKVIIGLVMFAIIIVILGFMNGVSVFWNILFA